MVEVAFGYWLSGFIDGEGSFVISRVTRRGTTDAVYNCRLTIALRDDDAAILDQIAASTGLGTTQPMRNYRRPNGYRQWVVWSKEDCAQLVELLAAFPLRTKKAADLAIWREAVAVWQTVQRGGRPATRRAVNARAWEEMERLRGLLNAGRVYRPSATL